jgi:TatD DNase family protein
MTDKMVARAFDFHCHVDLFPDPKALIAAYERDNIVTLAVTTTPKAWSHNQQWTDGSRYVYAAVGLHPELVGERHAEIALLESLMDETPFVGEVGLDGSPQHRRNFQTQTQVFSRVLSRAQSLGSRVLSIHSRRAPHQVLKSIAKHTTIDRVLPILHWFSGSLSLAQQALTLGCYFSVNRPMVQKPSGLALLRTLPPDRVLTETDAPFTSVKHDKSDMLNLVTLAEHLANIYQIPAHDIRTLLAANAERVFAFAGISATFESTY